MIILTSIEGIKARQFLLKDSMVVISSSVISKSKTWGEKNVQKHIENQIIRKIRKTEKNDKNKSEKGMNG